MEHCLFFNFRRVDRVLGQWYDQHLQVVGIKGTQFTLLRVLHHSGRISVSRFAEITDIDRTTLTRNLRLLLEQGWISIEPGSDRRVRQIELSVAGEAKYRQALPHWQEAQTAMVENLGRRRWERLKADLDGVINATRSLRNPDRFL